MYEQLKEDMNILQKNKNKELNEMWKLMNDLKIQFSSTITEEKPNWNDSGNEKIK